MDTDREHLRLLSIGHYVFGALAYGFSLLPLIYVGVGTSMLRHPEGWTGNGSPPPPAVGGVLVAVGLAFCVLGLGFATAVVAAGRFLGRHRHRTFCTVVAGLETMFFPVGTVLGALALVVLLRPSVRDVFEAAPRAPSSGAPGTPPR